MGGILVCWVRSGVRLQSPPRIPGFTHRRGTVGNLAVIPQNPRENGILTGCPQEVGGRGISGNGGKKADGPVSLADSQRSKSAVSRHSLSILRQTPKNPASRAVPIPATRLFFLTRFSSLGSQSFRSGSRSRMGKEPESTGRCPIETNHACPFALFFCPFARSGSRSQMGKEPESSGCCPIETNHACPFALPFCPLGVLRGPATRRIPWRTQKRTGMAPGMNRMVVRRGAESPGLERRTVPALGTSRKGAAGAWIRDLPAAAPL